MQNFRVELPTVRRIPILLSVPHCGTLFPHEVKEDFDSQLIKSPDDTDWFVDRLYNFASYIGITMISAVVSRWVIDLNRNPDDRPLYSDGRIITGLCPTTTFLGWPLYKDSRISVNPGEVRRRLDEYYRPYHEQVRAILKELKDEFGKVLLWDCHSIRQRVPTIQEEKFPDLILGSADGQAAGQALVHQVIKDLSSEHYSLTCNTPFKGGYITRQYGDPARGQHALQLEMSKVNYMDDGETEYDLSRAGKMAELLNKTLSHAAQALLSGEE